MKIERQSDKPQILGRTGPERLFCTDCKSRLYILPQDPEHYQCLECGQKWPLHTVVRDLHIRAIDDVKTTFVQPQTEKRKDRRPNSLVTNRTDTELARELRAKGFQVIDSTEDIRYQ